MQKIYLALFFAVLSCNVLGQDWLSLFIGSASKYASFSLLSSTSFPLRVSSSEAIYLLSSSTVAVSFPLAEVSERTRCRSLLQFTLEEVILALQKFYQFILFHALKLQKRMTRTTS